MRSPDDRLFIEIRSAYHKARAENRYADVARITRINFNWLMDYMETKLSSNLSRKARTVKKWKNLHDTAEMFARNYKKGSTQQKDMITIMRMVKDIIYVQDPPPTKERL